MTPNQIDEARQEHITRMREAAREARDRRRSPDVEPENTAFLKQKVSALEETVFALSEEVATMRETLAEALEAFSGKSTELSAKHSALERAISQKTIESLTRAQVARIMREEGGAK